MGITANQVTIAGFALGMMALPLLAFEMYYSALFMGTLNRVCDALDGAIARDQGITDVGGYLDIVLDFIFYSAVVFGFILAQPEQAVYGAFLIFSFIGSGYLVFSLFNLCGKKQFNDRGQGDKINLLSRRFDRGFRNYHYIYPDVSLASVFLVDCSHFWHALLDKHRGPNSSRDDDALDADDVQDKVNKESQLGNKKRSLRKA